MTTATLKKRFNRAKEFFTNSTPYQVVTTGINTAAHGAALGSTIILSTIIYQNVYQLWPVHFVAFVVTIVLELVVLFMIDFSFRRTAGFTWALALSGKWMKSWHAATLLLLLMSWNLTQLYVTARLGWDGRKDAIEAVLIEPEQLNAVVELEKIKNQQTQNYQLLTDQIKTIEQQIQQNKEQVRKDLPVYVQKIESGDDRWGWHAKELERITNEKNAGLIMELQGLRKALSETMTTNTAAAPKIVTTIERANQRKWGQYEQKKTRNESYIGWFSIICAAFLFFLTLTRELMRGLKNGWEFDLEEHLGEIPTFTMQPPHTQQPAQVATTVRNATTQRPPAVNFAFVPQQTQPTQQPTPTQPKNTTHTTNNGVAFVDLSDLDKNLRNWFKRSINSKTPEARAENLAKYKQAAEFLAAYGITYTPRPKAPQYLNRSIDKARFDKEGLSQAIKSLKV
jgi:hypothetical protein